jgi:predicted CoA-binding protein
MTSLEDAVSDFLSQSRVAVAGVSRASDIPANTIYRKFRDNGYEVFAVNPKAQEVEGDACYPNLGSVPGALDGVVVATPPSAAEGLVRECLDLGIPRVWMHRSFGAGSVSDEAVQLCREQGIAVIPGACPMMYLEPVDIGHKCFRWFLGVTGKMPSPEGFSEEG